MSRRQSVQLTLPDANIEAEYGRGTYVEDGEQRNKETCAKRERKSEKKVEERSIGVDCTKREATEETREHGSETNFTANTSFDSSRRYDGTLTFPRLGGPSFP